MNKKKLLVIHPVLNTGEFINAKKSFSKFKQKGLIYKTRKNKRKSYDQLL